MASIVRRFFGWLPGVSSGDSKAPRPRRSKLTNFFAGFKHDAIGNGQGGFEGGRLDRLTEAWDPGSHGPNRTFEMGGRRMRERARWLFDNNPIAKSAVQKFVANVIECGLKPSPAFGDQERRRTWGRAWRRWGGLTPLATREADITGDDTINELLALILVESIVAGGCLQHYVELPRRGRFLPLSVEMIPEERFAEHLVRAPGNPKSANPIDQGIEYEQATGRTVAYHVLPAIPNDSAFVPTDLETIRLPAERCEYLRFKRRIGQRRGHSLFHAAIVWLWALGYYTDNELHASNLKSSWAYWLITNPEHDEFDWTGLQEDEQQSGTQDFHGNIVDRHEPGMVRRGAPGDDIKAVGPNVPGSDSLPWLMLLQRSIAVGLDQTYEEVMGDYSQGNMASVRMSRDSVQKLYRRMHQRVVDHSANPLWGRFCTVASRTGLEGFPRPSELMADPEEWLNVNWSRPTWNSPNPVHDATARKINKEIGATTDRDIVEANGDADLEEHYDQLARERDEKRERDLRFVGDPQSATSTAEPDVEGMLAEEADDTEERR